MAAAIVLGCVGAASANVGGGGAGGGGAAVPDVPAEMAAQPASADQGMGSGAGAGAGGATDTAAEAPVEMAGAGDGNATVATAEAPVAMPGALDAVAPIAAVATVTDAAAFALVAPDYTLYPGVDYGPTTVPPPTVPIVDIVDGGFTTVDAAECAIQCSMTIGCNSASYYGDNAVELWPGAHLIPL